MKQIAVTALVALALAGCGAKPGPLAAGRPAGPASALAAPSDVELRAQVTTGLKKMIAKFDRNQDGALDRAEAVVANVQPEEFARRDRDGDGVLSFAEFGEDIVPGSVKGIKETAPKVVRHFDADRDGRLSRAEYMGSTLGFSDVAPNQIPRPDEGLKGELFDLHATNGKIDKHDLTRVLAAAYERGFGYGVSYAYDVGGWSERSVGGLGVAR